RRRHTRCLSDWSSDVCSSDLIRAVAPLEDGGGGEAGLAEPATHFGKIGCFQGHLRDGIADIGVETGRDEYEVRLVDAHGFPRTRSEERRVGKECRRRREP